MDKAKQTLLILLHLAGWTLFVYLTFPHFKGVEPPLSSLRFPWLYVACYSFLAAYFYCNVHVFVPKLLSGKKIALFLCVTVIAYLLFCFTIPWVFRYLLIPDTLRHFGPEMLPQRPDFLPPDGSRDVINRASTAPPRPFSLFRRLGVYAHSYHFLVVFTVSTGLKAVSQWYVEKQRLQELERSMVQAELSFLKSQIHPHFLFNSLNSIYYLALSKDDKAPEAILSLSDFLRFVTTESNHSRIPMEKEIKMLEEYLRLQNLRTSEKLELKVQVDGDFRSHTIMPLTFIPFVENAFKYGVSAYRSCFIHISATLEGGRLRFACDNSTISKLKSSSASTGVGLENIRKRLELAYAGRYSLEIKAEDMAYRVKLQIDLE
ncbi:MAG: histidine kinase [Prevotellaceae bacterium]|jgi:hypothetical protein|nr:histidine kinase [Prevotellaceae bacterium]